MRILCDLDGIVADFLGHLLQIYNEETGESVQVNDIRTWDMAGAVGQPRHLFGLFYEKGFFRDLKPMPGAQKALSALVRDGHEVVVLTAPCTPHSAAEKIIWCAEQLPFLDQKNVFIGHQKQMLVGDVLIDDAPRYATHYRQRWPESLIYTIAYAYNDGCPGVYNGRFGDYDHAEAAWSQIQGAVADSNLLRR